MLIQALTSFVGAVDMNMGEVREVDEKLASPLISCGYAEQVSTEPTEEKATEGTGGDADENIGHNGRGRKKGAKN